MPITNESALVDFDAEAAVRAVRDVASEGVLVCAEYTIDDFRVLYASDTVVDDHGGPDELRSIGERMHAYLHVDFTERGLFEDLYPPAEKTRAFVTYTDYATLVRVLGDAGGLYVSLTPDTQVTPVVDAVTAVVD